MVEEYWQKTPFYPAPSSCHAGGNAYEWPGKPKSNAQPTCSINLLLAQVKAQLCGTVVMVGFVGVLWGYLEPGRAVDRAGDGCCVMVQGGSLCVLGTRVFSSCFPVCSPLELEPELEEKARTQGKAGRLNIHL